MHFLNPSNPELHTSVFKFFRLFFQAIGLRVEASRVWGLEYWIYGPGFRV